MFLRYPEKLAIDAAGKPLERAVSIEDVLGASDRNEILSRIIDRLLLALLYKAPNDQFAYIAKVLSLHLDSETRAAYSELKATRDLIVHNRGIVNDAYLAKAGAKARAKRGDLIPLDGAYLSKAIQCVKRLVSTLNREVSKKFGSTIRIAVFGT